VARIALILNDDFSMWQFRSGLIRSLVASGHDVTAIVPDGEYCEALEALGARVVTTPMSRFVAPVADLRLFVRLLRLFRRERFDLVHTMTVKPNVFGTLAARLAGVPRVVALVCGAGYLFVPPQGPRERVVQAIGRGLYKVAFRYTDRCWFENPDDLADFVGRGIIDRERALLILGGGVDTERFVPGSVSDEEIGALRQELRIAPGSKTVVMVSARLVRSKGVQEFLAAARAHAERWPSWVFVLLAPVDPAAPDALPVDEVERLAGANTRLILGFRHRVERFFALADVVVLPTTYREGVPTVLLEAMAMGVPLIATDMPGCREAVLDDVNGYLVPAGDAEQLIDRLSVLIGSEEKRRSFGRAGVRLANEKFSDEKVNTRVIKELYLIDQGAGAD
jgi:N,N'-diacetylbacillosaminyl-diphospho-undecaprenol alpha-1,3-N-acetylgalactosaminyltransferase